MAQSSIVYTKESQLSGSKLFLNDVQQSIVDGQGLDLEMLTQSTVTGTHSAIFDSQNNTIDATFSMVTHSMNNLIDVNRSYGNQLNFSDIQLDYSTLDNVNDLTILSRLSSGAQLESSDLIMTQSSLFFVDYSSLGLMESNAYHINDSVLEIMKSNASFLSSTFASANRSMLQRVSDSDLNLSNSYISNVDNANLTGDHQLVFDAKNINISGDFVVSMQGNGQTINSDHVIAIGPNIDARHDHTLLLNASKKPLHSDRDGQLKIQADGDVRIQFDHDMGISMVDGMGQYISDKNLKFDFTEIDPKMILQKVRELPIYYWSYKTQDKALHLGPVAQDFAKIFNYGNSETVIHSIDSDGVLLASIQALNDQLREMEKGYNNISRLTDRSSGYLTEMNQELDALIQRSTDLDRSFFNYLYKLDQFENDYDTQVQMTEYIQNVTTKISYGYRLNMIMQPIGLTIIVIMGIIFGVLIQIIRYRRKT